jgi:hypothetical protein
MKTSASAVLALALGLSLGGCLDNPASVEFYGLCGFPDDAAACAPPLGKCDTYQNGQLFAYPAGTNTLLMVAQFNNQRPGNGDTTSGRVNTADARITHYKYKFTANPARALDAWTESYLSTPIAAAGTSTVWIPIIPPHTMAQFRAVAPAVAYDGQVQVEITAVGDYTDGTTFEVAPFIVPVNVISGSAPTTITCTAPAVPVYCPSQAQTHSAACVTP